MAIVPIDDPLEDCLIGLERELAEILGGTVDVVPARNLKPGIVERVVAEAIEL